MPCCSASGRLRHFRLHIRNLAPQAGLRHSLPEACWHPPLPQKRSTRGHGALSAGLAYGHGTSTLLPDCAIAWSVGSTRRLACLVSPRVASPACRYGTRLPSTSARSGKARTALMSGCAMTAPSTGAIVRSDGRVQGSPGTGVLLAGCTKRLTLMRGGATSAEHFCGPRQERKEPACARAAAGGAWSVSIATGTGRRCSLAGFEQAVPITRPPAPPAWRSIAGWCAQRAIQDTGKDTASAARRQRRAGGLKATSAHRASPSSTSRRAPACARLFIGMCR